MCSFRKMSEKRGSERMSDSFFRIMAALMAFRDFFFAYIDKRVRGFGIESGMTVVDYGCGPGRYTTRFAEMVGENGKVYAVDIHELAIDSVKKRMEKHNLQNIEPVLADGYDCGLPDGIADVVCAIDMFFSIKNPTEFLRELRRITKNDGLLVIDEGHQSRSLAIEKILNSGYWDVVEESKDHMKCRPC